MRRMPWPAYLWPGLPQLARDGNWAALAVGRGGGGPAERGAAGHLRLTEIVAPGPRIICWTFLGLAWSGAIGFWTWNDRQRAATLATTDGKTFEEAVAEYLKGNWFEAERKLNFLLRSEAATSRPGSCWPRSCGEPGGSTKRRAN